MRPPRMTIRRWQFLVAVAAVLALGWQTGWRWRYFHEIAAWHITQAAMYKARANARLAAPRPISGDPVAMSVEDGLRQIEMAKRSRNVYLGDYSGPPHQMPTSSRVSESILRIPCPPHCRATDRAAQSWFFFPLRRGLEGVGSSVASIWFV